MFNVIARRTLIRYVGMHPSSSSALYRWYEIIEKSTFRNFNELKAVFPDASIVGDDRVVFNIMGNQFRLVVRIVFEYRVIQIKWFGPHHEYDKIDVTTIRP